MSAARSVVSRHVVPGVVAGGAALATTEGLAALLNLRESPVVALAQTVVRLTPGALAEGVIGLVGTADKPLVIACVVVGVVALSVLVAQWWSTRRPAALVVVAAMLAATVGAVLSRPYASLPAVFAALAGAVALMGALELMRHEQERRRAVDGPQRRRVISATVVIAVAAVVVGAGSQLLASRHRRRRRIEELRSALDLPSTDTQTPAGADLDAAMPWRTPNRDFYRIDTSLAPPLIDPYDWRLRIHGMVDRELTLRYEDLMAREHTDAWVTLCCVSNEVGGDLIGNALWGGVRIKDLLEEVGVDDGADALLSTSDDGWTCGTPLEALTDGREALLAVTMNGEPLPIVHGFPVRQVVPGLYGYVSATKWVTDWKVSRFADFTAYWTGRGWGERGPIKTGSRIDVPRRNSAVRVGRQQIAGVAWRQHVGIERVEVRIDEGAWRTARLGRVPNVDTWVQWSLDWDATAGQHQIEVRATDRTGEVQTATKRDVLPDGATGHHVIRVRGE